MSRLAKIRKLKRTRVIKTRQCILDLIKKRTASKSQELIIDFTTTACVRPWVLDATYKSYSTNLKGIDFKKCTLYINVDPIGNTSQYSAEDVVAVAEKYFKEVVANTPDKANFALASKWCLTQPTREYFFHLEDDWELVREVNIQDMLSMFKENTLQVVLNKGKNQTLLRETGEPMFVPSLIKTKHMKYYTEVMEDSGNPEQRVKQRYRRNKRNKPPSSIFFNIKLPYSVDRGRRWLRQHKFARDRRNIGNAGWQTWRKTK